MWLKCLQVLTELDCLASLAIVSGQAEHPMTRPVFREEGEVKLEENKDGADQVTGESYLELRQMVHPCVTLGSSKNFIPNDTIIDTSDK